MTQLLKGTSDRGWQSPKVSKLKFVYAHDANARTNTENVCYLSRCLGDSGEVFGKNGGKPETPSSVGAARKQAKYWPKLKNQQINMPQYALLFRIDMCNFAFILNWHNLQIIQTHLGRNI